MRMRIMYKKKSPNQQLLCSAAAAAAFWQWFARLSFKIFMCLFNLQREEKIITLLLCFVKYFADIIWI